MKFSFLCLYVHPVINYHHDCQHPNTFICATSVYSSEKPQQEKNTSVYSPWSSQFYKHVYTIATPKWMEKSTPAKIVFSLFLGFTPVTILNQLQSYHGTLTSSRLDALWHLVGMLGRWQILTTPQRTFTRGSLPTLGWKLPGCQVGCFR